MYFMDIRKPMPSISQQNPFQCMYHRNWTNEAEKDNEFLPQSSNISHSMFFVGLFFVFF